MRRIIKPEDIRRDKKIVKIPDVDFKIDPPPGDDTQENEESSNSPVITPELREEITGELRNELAGELSRKRIKAKSECDMLIKNAQEEASAILASAEMQKRQIMNDAQMQAAQLRQEAMAEGEKKGFEDKAKLLENLALYISHSIEEIKKERNEFFEQYAKELRHLAVDISEKVIAQKIEEDDMIMYGVIKDALRYVRDTKWVKAEVSAELTGYIDTLEKELAASGQNVEFILTNGLPKESCIINTSDGLVDATLSEQLKNLREFIDNLDKGDSDEG